MLSNFAAAVQTRPHDLAVFDPQRRFTFAQLSHAVDALAHTLTRAGARPQDSVAWLGPIGLECVVFALATQKAGLVMFAPNLGNTDSAIRQLFTDAKVRCVVMDPLQSDRAQALGMSDAIPYRAQPDVVGPPFVQADVPHDALSNLTHTSGSTGSLKLIAQTRASQAFFDQVAADLAQFQPTDVQCIVGHLWPAIPFSAVRAQVPIGCFDAATHGPRALAEWMVHEKITTLMAYPALYRQLTDTQILQPDLKFVMLAGEPLSRRDAEAFNQITTPGARLVNSFGAMEFPCLGAYAYPHGAAIDFQAMPMGSPIQPDLLKLIDEDGNACLDGEIGEIQICSPHLPDGYLNGIARDPEKFDTRPSGLRTYRTGDLAYRDGTGIYYAMGRRDQQVKIRGYNVRLNEVEAAIQALDGVREAALVARQNANGSRRLDCHYVGTAQQTMLQTALRGTLPNYMMPARFYHHDALPKTTSGKIRRNALEIPAAAGPSPAAVWTDETERTIRQLMIPIVGHDGFSPIDDIFDLGVDSLQAMSLLLALEQTFHRRLPFESFILNGASARALARRLKDWPCTNRVVRLKRGTSGSTVVVAPNIGGGFSSYVELMHAWGDGAEFLGVHPRGMRSGDIADATIRSIATDAVDQLVRYGTSIDVLIGYSSGGPVVYEMATHLRALGKPVPSIALLDPVAPWEEPSRLWRRLRNATSKVLGALKTGTAPGLSTFARKPNRSEFVETHLNALSAYRPPVALQAHAFLMLVEQRQSEIRAAAWTDILGERATIYTGPGNHSSAVRGRNAVLLAHHLQRWLLDAKTDRGATAQTLRQEPAAIA